MQERESAIGMTEMNPIQQESLVRDHKFKIVYQSRFRYK